MYVKDPRPMYPRPMKCLMQVKDLRPRLRGIQIRVKVVSVQPNIFVEGIPTDQAFVGDETGAIALELQGDLRGIAQAGLAYEVEGGYTALDGRYLTLRAGSLREISGDAIPSVLKTNYLSGRPFDDPMTQEEFNAALAKCLREFEWEEYQDTLYYPIGKQLDAMMGLRDIADRLRGGGYALLIEGLCYVEGPEFEGSVHACGQLIKQNASVFTRDLVELLRSVGGADPVAYDAHAIAGQVLSERPDLKRIIETTEWNGIL